MNYFERTLLNFLRKSYIKVEITGFDTDAFSKALHRELRRRLDAIEYIAFDDSGLMSDAEKIATIKAYFEEDFDSKE